MAEKFDEFSKHLARKQSRRGALKFLGGGLISAFVATVFSRGAEADHRKRDFRSFLFNAISPGFNGTFPPNFNVTLPDFNYTLPEFNFTLPDFNATLPPKFNKIFSDPRFNSTLPPKFNSTFAPFWDSSRYSRDD